ncbi:MAG: C2 domain-containing protein, partial [Myxococcales bacterium]|nr:C2 domain-containing protein [Myxococcales bacterium]
KGSVELLFVDSSSRRLSLPERQDTFHPTWTGIVFDQVPLVEGLRLRIQLFDADDIGSDDPIGTAELTYEDVVAALSYEQVLHVRVYEQTQGQLLFVGISVTAH